MPYCYVTAPWLLLTDTIENVMDVNKQLRHLHLNTLKLRVKNQAEANILRCYCECKTSIHNLK